MPYVALYFHGENTRMLTLHRPISPQTLPMRLRLQPLPPRSTPVLEVLSGTSKERNGVLDSLKFSFHRNIQIASCICIILGWMAYIGVHSEWEIPWEPL
jgi:hypothetical protein